MGAAGGAVGAGGAAFKAVGIAVTFDGASGGGGGIVGKPETGDGAGGAGGTGAIGAADVAGAVTLLAACGGGGMKGGALGTGGAAGIEAAMPSNESASEIINAAAIRSALLFSVLVSIMNCTVYSPMGENRMMIDGAVRLDQTDGLVNFG